MTSNNASLPYLADGQNVKRARDCRIVATAKTSTMAALIARALNAHDPMAAALRSLVESDERTLAYDVAAWNRAKESLALANGGGA